MTLAGRLPRAAALLLLGATGWLGSCGGTQPSVKPGGGGPGSQPSASQPAKHGTIEGDIERSRARRHMKIWGQVERIKSGAHGQLPPLTAMASGGGGDPVTEIRNQTQFRLTIWFAGKCSNQMDVPPQTNVTAIFCAGSYNLAAMVDDRAFLPLVREDQEFEQGVRYRLDFFVQKAPR